MKHAVLPESLEEDTISSLMTGEAGYVVPWGMWVDKNRQCWLHPEYRISDVPHGTASMRIELRPDGFHAWPPSDHAWSVQERAGYVGSEGVDFIPVAELHC